MHRAEMIAGQALRTPLAPNRLPVHTDIVHRTDLFTDTTADAGIRSMKPTGRHQETAEQGTNYIGFQERHASLMTVKTTLPAGDLDLNLSHTPPGFFPLTGFHFRSIHIKPRQTDICVRHKYGITGLTGPAPTLHRLAKDFSCLSGIIPSSTDKIKKRRLPGQTKSGNHFKHDFRRPPGIDRKNKSQSLLVPKCIYLI